MPGYLVLAGVALVFGWFIKQRSDSNRYTDRNGAVWILGTTYDVETKLSSLSARPLTAYEHVPMAARLIHADNHTTLVDEIELFALANRAFV